ncbi:hypothetical protein LDENG_00059020 [Lucifuga dentata]|nr:hypothetical protein LDENG_00059020 [Lucifuga dentata]
MISGVSKIFLFWLSCMLLEPMSSMQMCEMMMEVEREREQCLSQIENKTTGCTGVWDKITCWPSADVGEVVTIPCPKYLFYFSKDVHAGTNSV